MKNKIVDDSKKAKRESQSISQMILETSRSNMQQSSYQYDTRTGLYYDHRSGYYYDPVGIYILM